MEAGLHLGILLFLYMIMHVYKGMCLDVRFVIIYLPLSFHSHIIHGGGLWLHYMPLSNIMFYLAAQFIWIFYHLLGSFSSLYII